MTKVSALVSAYKAVPFMADRITNLMSSTLIPEIVVVAQKGSKESEIAKSFELDNLVLVETENIPTVYSAWNTAIENATGEYLTTANTDDFINKTGYEEMAKVLDNNNKIGLVYTNITILKEGTLDVISRFAWEEGGFDKLIKGCFVGPMPMWRKSLHEEYGMFDPEFVTSGDWDFWLRLAHGGVKFEHINKYLGKYTKRASSIENSHMLLKIWENARIRAKYRKEFRL